MLSIQLSQQEPVNSLPQLPKDLKPLNQTT